MPNGVVHKSAGAILGGLAYLVIQNNSQQKGKLELVELFFSIFIGNRTARIPDILEPPIHPNHRDFFHSLAFGIMVGYVGFKLFEELKKIRSKRTLLGIKQWSNKEYGEIAIIIACGSILLHLIMDGFTVKGLNII